MKTILRSATIAIIFVAALLTAASASAQGIAPRVLILFDTSGSMLWDTQSNATHGDGSQDHPGLDTNGDGQSNDSKMFVAKEAVRDILINSGADIEFGLARFHQDEGIDILDEGSDGRRYREPINYSGWGACAQNTGGADILVDIGPNNRTQMLSWMDGVENFPSNKELRGTGWTPLALSLSDAWEHFSFQVIPGDTQRDCRSFYVIMITDGVRECPNGTPDRDPVFASAALRSVLAQGDVFDVKTFVVGFGRNVNGSDQLNRMARAGGTATNDQGAIDLVAGNALFANDRDRLREVLGNVLVDIVPQEVCDGRDNDCDGQIDEDWPTLGDSCAAGVGECRVNGEVVCTDSGTSVICDAEPRDRQNELCDGRDNDCDTEIDEGTFNACGECGPVPQEVCDGIDNDCDGARDEGVLNACGGCGAVGRELCNGIDDDCDGPIDEGLLNACGDCGPTPREDCDGLDNDCDDIIDEGFDTDCGNCTPTGPELCDGRDNDCDAIIDEGVRNACNDCGEVPSEICDNVDNNCDGEVDEGVRNNCGDCGPEPPESCNEQDDDCDGQIDEGVENACRRCGPDFNETCDNIDNDCNGVVDDDVVCPEPGNRCVNGECAGPCQAGECFQGRICVDGVCVLPCNNVDCPSGFVCQNGECADPCVGIECREGLSCSLGACVDEDCYVAGCPDGQVCTGGACLDDPCDDVVCAENQGCRDGGCFDTCLDVICPDGQSCERGVCFDDPCAGRACSPGRMCVDGNCVDDPCAEVICEPGLACYDGECQDDPCLRTTCPEGTRCLRGDCLSENDNSGEVDNGEGGNEDPGPDTGNGDGPIVPGAGVPTGAEACGCISAARPAPAPTLPLFLLAALTLGLAALRRRP